MRVHEAALVGDVGGVVVDAVRDGDVEEDHDRGRDQEAHDAAAQRGPHGGEGMVDDDAQEEAQERDGLQVVVGEVAHRGVAHEREGQRGGAHGGDEAVLVVGARQVAERGAGERAEGGPHAEQAEDAEEHGVVVDRPDVVVDPRLVAVGREVDLGVVLERVVDERLHLAGRGVARHDGPEHEERAAAVGAHGPEALAPGEARPAPRGHDDPEAHRDDRDRAELLAEGVQHPESAGGRHEPRRGRGPARPRVVPALARLEPGDEAEERGHHEGGRGLLAVVGEPVDGPHPDQVHHHDREVGHRPARARPARAAARKANSTVVSPHSAAARRMDIQLVGSRSAG